MRNRIRDRLLMWTWGLAMLLMTPMMSFAQRGQETGEDAYDARVLGYGQGVELEDSTTALTWLLLIFLTAVGLGVLFKDAKRTLREFEISSLRLEISDH